MVGSLIARSCPVGVGNTQGRAREKREPLFRKKYGRAGPTLWLGGGNLRARAWSSGQFFSRGDHDVLLSCLECVPLMQPNLTAGKHFVGLKTFSGSKFLRLASSIHSLTEVRARCTLKVSAWLPFHLRWFLYRTHVFDLGSSKVAQRVFEISGRARKTTTATTTTTTTTTTTKRTLSD